MTVVLTLSDYFNRWVAKFQAPTTPISLTELLIRFATVFLFFIVFQIVMGRLAVSREVKRRWGHVLTGHLFIQASYIPFPLWWSVSGLAFATWVVYYWFHYDWNTYMNVLGPYLRQDELERKKYAGAFWFLVSMLAVAILFPLPTARYGVECMGLADPIAAWIGQSIPSPKIQNYLIIRDEHDKKQPLLHTTASVSGSLACFLSAWIVGFFMLPYNEQHDNTPNFVQITVGALACTLGEAFPFIVNDNLTIPIVTAFAVSFFSG